MELNPYFQPYLNQSLTSLYQPVKPSECRKKCRTSKKEGRQVTIPPIYLDIGMSAHFEGFGVVK